MQNNLPCLTIVIPTLNRSETLFWSIKTVIEHDYINLKIIVSDNCSEDNTYDVVKQFTDKRLQYIKTPLRFTMMQHFEYVLNYTNEGYISILGDDDGFVPGSLSKVLQIINKHQPKAIGWRFGNYNWPGLPPHFMIPMSNYYRIVNAQKEIKRIFNQNIYQTVQFPSLYGGFISIDLINELKQKFNGVFFHSRIPDFFAGAFIAANVDTYIRLEYPVTLNATSKSSAGYATVNPNINQKAFEGLKVDEGNKPFHPSLKFIRCNVVPIAEALLRVNQLVPSFPKVSIQKIITETVIELAAESDENKFNEIKSGLIEMGKINNIEDFVESSLAKMVRKPSYHLVKEKYSPLSITLYVDSGKTNTSNVHEAVIFVNRIISQSTFRLFFSWQKYYCSMIQMSRYLSFKYLSSKRKYFK